MLPITKWTGSKRYQASDIVSNFPKEINTYYEPFIGGGSVLCEYINRLESGNYKCNHIICSDTNYDLIQIYIMVRDNYKFFLNEYEKLYNEFAPLNINDRKVFYNKIRDTYNQIKRDNNTLYNERRIIYFNWLMRNCFNGLVRYNKQGDFTTSCYFTRSGIKPNNLEKIIYEWNYLLNKYNVQFFVKSYNQLENIQSNDLVYCDPPYDISGGMYDYDTFDKEHFFN